MNVWKYEIRSKSSSDEILMENSGFETEEDAQKQGIMDADMNDLKNWYIITLQEWQDL